MIPRMLGVLLTVALSVLAGATPGRAESEFIELALFPPIQIFDEETDIGGVRIMGYGVNNDVTGVDVAIAGRTLGNYVGLQWTVVGIVGGSFRGWQNGAVYNSTAGTFEGFQSGAVNRGSDVVGFQVGLVNYDERMKGFQISIFNYAEELDGLQIGLVNIAENAMGHSILPIVNWVF